MSQKASHGQAADGQRSNPRHNEVANNERPARSNGHDETIDTPESRYSIDSKFQYCGQRVPCTGTTKLFYVASTN